MSRCVYFGLEGRESLRSHRPQAVVTQGDYRFWVLFSKKIYSLNTACSFFIFGICNPPTSSHMQGTLLPNLSLACLHSKPKLHHEVRTALASWWSKPQKPKGILLCYYFQKISQFDTKSIVNFKRNQNTNNIPQNYFSKVFSQEGLSHNYYIIIDIYKQSLVGNHIW